MGRLAKIREIKRIQNPRNYSSNTLRLDMAEKGNLFPKNFFKNFIEYKLKEIDFIAYPDYQRYFDFEDKIKNKFKFSNDSIVLETGSDSLIKLIIQCFCPENRVISTLNPSFPMYNIYGLSLGANVEHIKFESKTHISVKDIILNLNEKTCILFISNPCSPYGSLYSDNDINQLLVEAEKRNFILCLDEAYIDFAPKHTHNNIENSKNLIRIRTFSKAIGAAGIRLGYAITNKVNSNLLKSAQLTFPITGPSLSFGEYILENYEIIEKYINNTKLSRDYICKKLRLNKYDVLSSHTNSIHLHPPHNCTEKLIALINSEDVLIKHGSNIGVPVKIPKDPRNTWIRMSVFEGLEKTDFFKKMLKIR